MNPDVTDFPNYDLPADLFPDPLADLGSGEAGNGTARGGSAANAVKDGLRSEKYFPYDLEVIIKRCLAALLETYQPTTAHQLMAVVELAKAEGKLEKATAMEIADMHRVQHQALTSWDSDRRAYVDTLAKKLGDEPDRVKRALERSKQGTDWLSERWARLARLVANTGGATEEQRRLMFDLLGIEGALREGSTEVPAAGDGAALAALCQVEFDRLKKLREDGLLEKDERWQTMAICGMPYDADAETKRIWRQAAAARGLRNDARKTLERLQSRPARVGPRSPAAPGSATPSDSELDHYLHLQPDSRPEPRPEPKPKPELPPSPVVSEADRANLVRQSLEIGAHLDALKRQAYKAAAAAEPEAAESDPIGITPAAILDRAAEATKARLDKAQRKKREDDERRRKRNQQKESRKGGRRRR